MKRLLISLFALVVAFYAIPAQATTTTLPSSGSNTQIWDGSSWTSPYQIPRKDANAGASDATTVVGGWGWNCGCETYGDTARAETDCPWQDLYDLGAEWVSVESWSNYETTGTASFKYFRHRFNIPSGWFAKNMKVIIACDDAVDVLLDHTGNPDWTPYGSAFIDTANGYCNLKTIDIGCIGPGNHEMQFVLKNYRASYFGMIYVIQYELVPLRNLEITPVGDCCFEGKFTWYNTSGSTLTNFDVSVTTPGVSIRAVSVSGDLLSRDWTASGAGSNTARYTGGGGYSNCQEVETFRFCVDAPSNLSSFDIIINYYKGEDLLRQDTIRNISLENCCTCDDINLDVTSIDPPANCNADCCVDLQLHSDCDLDDIEAVGITLPPGVSFACPPTAPTGFGMMNCPGYNAVWHFPNPNGYFAAGTYSPFRLCFNNTGASTFTIVIHYMDGNCGDICKEKIKIKCDNDTSNTEDKCCTSIKFDGSEPDEIKLPASTTAYAVPQTPTGGFTWETWFKLNASITDTSIGWGPILICIDNNNPSDGQDIVLSFGAPTIPKNKLVFWVDGGGGRGVVSISPSTTPNFVAGKWYHVAAIMDYGTPKIEIILAESDCTTGVLNVTGTVGTIFGTPTPITPAAGGWTPEIGAWDGATKNGEYFDGWMDDIRFWNVPRTAMQINNNRRKGRNSATPNPAIDCWGVLPASLTAYYPILQSDVIGIIGGIKDLTGSGLNGTATGGTLKTQPPPQNAAPLECCCICDKINYNINKIDAEDICECCYKIDITVDDICGIDAIDCITFRVNPPVQFCDGTPPTGTWSSISLTRLVWIIPPGTLPGNMPFKLCFNSVPNGPFPLIVDYWSGDCQKLVCTDTLWLKCNESCCDYFDKFKIDTRTFSSGSIIWLWGLVTVQPPPTIRFSATLAYVEKVCPSSSLHTWSDIFIITPPILGAATGLPLRPTPTPPPLDPSHPPLNLGAGDLHEAIWGSYRPPISSATLLSSPFLIVFQIDPVPLYPYYLKFAVRYEWTALRDCDDDNSSSICCCTCDTLIWYKVKLRRRWIPRPNAKSGDDISMRADDAGVFITMKSFSEGTLEVWNPSEKGSDDSFDILGLILTTGDGVKPTSIKDKNTGENGTVKDSSAMINTKIGPEEFGTFDITFDNKDKAKFLCRLSVKIKFKDIPDTLTLPLAEFYARYNSGGDIVDVDTTTQLNNIKTYALFLHNLNKGKENIAKVEISVDKTSDCKIMAIGSEALTESAKLEVFRTDDDKYILYPVPVTDALPEGITPNDLYSPIYLTIQYINDNNIILNYKTLNADNEVISENKITLKKPTLVEDNNDEKDNSVRLSLYPNPASQEATLQINSLLELYGTKLELIDLNGNIIRTIFNNAYIGNGINVYTIGFNGLSNGVYLLRLKTNMGIFTAKVVVTK